MKTIELKLKQKNEFKYQLKEGSKVRSTIIKVSDGWSVNCIVHRNTLDAAIEYARSSQEEMLNAFGGNYAVVVK